MVDVVTANGPFAVAVGVSFEKSTLSIVEYKGEGTPAPPTKYPKSLQP